MSVNVCVVGTSHLAFCTAVAAAKRGHTVYSEEEIEKAELVLVAQDVWTDKNGQRDTRGIRAIVEETLLESSKSSPICMVVCSQVECGFTRSLGLQVYHQPEQLRIVTATENACNPPRIVVGCAEPTTFEELPAAYRAYLASFECPVILTDYETAEFSKIAINMWLAAQVDTTNRLAAAAAKVGADWETVAKAMRLDPRIGPEAYLTPGRWQDSLHLLRDSVTLTEIERAR